MLRSLTLPFLLLTVFGSQAFAEEMIIDDSDPLALPKPGAHQLRILAPELLELTLVTTKNPDPVPVEQWNFVSTNGVLKLPALKEFVVTSGAAKIPVQQVGFKRRVLYAPLRQRDLRIGNQLYLVLGSAIASNATVEVKNPSRRLWPANVHFVAKMDPLRYSPVLHVNQLGYLPAAPKRAMAGYYLGTLDEMKIPAAPTFAVVQLADNKPVYSGTMKPRLDKGFPFQCYNQVWEPDFSDLREPGEYRLLVPQLGTSFPFWIGEGVAAALARTYALGLYHQRCGTNNVLPFTRWTHGPCHIAPASVPLPESQFPDAWRIIAGKTVEATNDPRHVAPALKDAASCLYPFIRYGEIEVSGGHHDAGDYSKYTINSALLIHHLIFALDTFPGIAELDNLGLPESGDGKSDILQEAKWEADFLAKLQDDDGGFYFLVYPRDREYESELLPDSGDRQIVWPKTTAATAASVAALAQCASSPQFKKQFPDAAAAYLEKAKKGWKFLEAALAKYGNDGAYQKLTHYSAEFQHDDELAWAACEMFIATRDQALHTRLRHLFDPGDPHTRKWGWVRLYEDYGCAIRSYAFAARSGKVATTDLDLGFLSKCENEIIAAGQDQLKRAQNCAYGTSFPTETKRVRSAGWYFACDPAFDLAVAGQLEYPINNDPRPHFFDAIWSNFNYQLGCNPVNVSHLTGVGSRRQHEIVHQYAVSDRRVLPPAGIPIGDIQSGFGWLEFYKQELGALTWPRDGEQQNPYPMYDRWGDSFNLSTEFVILDQARGLATAAFLMAQTSLKTQPWKPALATIVPGAKSARGSTSWQLAPGLPDLNNARIVWEAAGEEPASGASFRPHTNGLPAWIEAEALSPQGIFRFAETNSPTPPTAPRTAAKR